MVLCRERGAADKSSSFQNTVPTGPAGSSVTVSPSRTTIRNRVPGGAGGKHRRFSRRFCGTGRLRSAMSAGTRCWLRWRSIWLLRTIWRRRRGRSRGCSGARGFRRPWFPDELRTQRTEALVWAPAAFRKHGVYISARDLEAAGPGPTMRCPAAMSWSGPSLPGREACRPRRIVAATGAADLRGLQGHCAAHQLGSWMATAI